MIPLIKKTQEIIYNNTLGKLAGSRYKLSNIAANPNQATVVKCHAKRSTCLVKLSEPNNFGKSLLNKRISMCLSPRYEWTRPINTKSAELMASMFFLCR